MQTSQFRQQKLQQFDIRQNVYNNTWKTDLMGAMCANPLWCCFSTFCASCASYMNRKQALYNDMSRYTCCAGACPCSGRMNEQECPELCLAAEVCFCFTQSVASTRWMIQDEQRIQNTQCDNCLIGTMVAMQYLACLCDIAACLSGSQEVAELAHCTDNIAQVTWCTVCACMQTQAKVQLDERDRGGQAQPPHPLQAPGQQYMGSQQQQAPPQQCYPGQGYQPQQQQGSQPQQQGYPSYPNYPSKAPPPPGSYGQPQGYPGAGYPGQPQQMTRY